MKSWKFGVVGTGYIAGQFAKGMRAVENAEIGGLKVSHRICTVSSLMIL